MDVIYLEGHGQLWIWMGSFWEKWDTLLWLICSLEPSLPSVEGRWGLVEKGPCTQEPKVSKCRQTRDPLTLTSLPKEDCDVLERAQDPARVCQIQVLLVSMIQFLIALWPLVSSFLKGILLGVDAGINNQCPRHQAMGSSYTEHLLSQPGVSWGCFSPANHKFISQLPSIF